jgi:hypothetical protein
MPRSEAKQNRSTDEVLRRGVIVVLVGGLVLFQGVNLVQALATGEPLRIVGGLIGFAFWAWLTWRLVILVRSEDVSEDPHYWGVGTIGFAVILLAALVVHLYRSLSGEDTTQSWIGFGIGCALTLTQALAWRRTARAERV